MPAKVQSYEMFYAGCNEPFCEWYSDNYDNEYAAQRDADLHNQEEHS